MSLLFILMLLLLVGAGTVIFLTDTNMSVGESVMMSLIIVLTSTFFGYILIQALGGS